jgi:hypothetical protein
LKPPDDKKPESTMDKIRRIAADPAFRARCEAKLAAEKAEMQAQREAALRREDNPGPAAVYPRLARAGVPPVYLETLKLGAYPTPALNAADDWWAAQDPTRPTLLLFGWTGSGKSLAAVTLMARHLAAHKPNSGPTTFNPAEMALWVQGSELDLLSEYKAQEVARVDAMVRCHFLVLDDLSTERANENAPAMGHIHRLLTERYAHRRRTVITTNLNLGDFEKRYGARIWSRMQEGAVQKGSGKKDLRNPAKLHSVP